MSFIMFMRANDMLCMEMSITIYLLIFFSKFNAFCKGDNIFLYFVIVTWSCICITSIKISLNALAMHLSITFYIFYLHRTGKTFALTRMNNVCRACKQKSAYGTYDNGIVCTKRTLTLPPHTMEESKAQTLRMFALISNSKYFCCSEPSWNI
jgi:hypothetical protein